LFTSKLDFPSTLQPIYGGSPEKKGFVAWCSIHRWTPQTLLHLLGMLNAEHNRLQGELADTAGALSGGDRKSQVAAQKRHDQLVGLRAELASFIQQVQDIAERGAPCLGCTPREADAPFAMKSYTSSPRRVSASRCSQSARLRL